MTVRQRKRPRRGSGKGARGPKEARRGNVLITGASSGIGLELARVFASEGFDVVLVARHRPNLAAVASELENQHGCRAVPIPCDLSKPDGAKKLFAAVRRRRLHIDVLVNNAGVVLVDRFVENPLDAQMELIALNVTAVAALARLFAAEMAKRRSGRILNVASVAAFQPTPWLALYGASKAFVLSLTESLSVELAESGVTVTALCPGFTDTPLLTSAKKALRRPNLVPSLLTLETTKVAREGYEACMAGRAICISGLPYELAVYWERLQPRWLIRSLGSLLLGGRFQT